jgi:hypothetical protein
LRAGNDLQSYPGLPEENEALDDLNLGEDAETEEVGDIAEEA